MFFSFALSTFEKILNSYLLLDPATKMRLAALKGKIIVLEFQHVNIKVFWLPHADGIHLADHFNGLADVTLRGSPFDFIRLSATSKNNANLFASGITVIGDTDVAQEFKALFANLDIDWEEQLSHFTGDVVAHQVGNLIKAMCQWAKQSTATIQQDLSEYIHEEVRWLPSREELQDFFAATDKLRDDVERTALHIKNLEKKLDKYT